MATRMLEVLALYKNMVALLFIVVLDHHDTQYTRDKANVQNDFRDTCRIPVAVVPQSPQKFPRRSLCPDSRIPLM